MIGNTCRRHVLPAASMVSLIGILLVLLNTSIELKQAQALTTSPSLLQGRQSFVLHTYPAVQQSHKRTTQQHERRLSTKSRNKNTALSFSSQMKYNHVSLQKRPFMIHPRTTTTHSTTRTIKTIVAMKTSSSEDSSSTSKSRSKLKQIKDILLSSSDKEDDVTQDNDDATTTTTTSTVELNDSEQEDEEEVKTPSVSTGTKIRRLKDRMWVREALEDITAAEFAISVEASKNALAQESESTTSTITAKKLLNKQKRGMDVENLLQKLDKRVEDVCMKSTYGTVKDEGNQGISCFPLDRQLSSNLDDFNPEQECWTLKADRGMARYAYTEEQRDALIMRILSSREKLLNCISGNVESNKAEEQTVDQIRKQLQNSPSDSTNTTIITSASVDVYVREDGTVDWDGALQDRAALKQFGISVWARINGQDPETVDEDSVPDEGEADVWKEHDDSKVTVKIIETKEIREKKARLDLMKNELKIMDAEHTSLLNSAVEAGSAVAKLNLATLDPEKRTEIRLSGEALDRKKDEVSFQILNYELERIYTYLDTEVGNPSTKGYVPLQDRLNVAEFGLLESQIENLNSQIATDGIVDSDVLAVVIEQTTDFKRRLGIDYYVQGITFDWDGIKIWYNGVVDATKVGLSFYGRGLQLFWNDVVFSIALIGKALQGYTLKPREVRTLRRTFRDVITFIPFAIIWSIPITPAGHALVFGAIQKFFPEFFPSSFTERRQNLLSLYETTEFTKVTIDENWNEKVKRIYEAAVFFVTDNTKKIYKEITNAKDSEEIKK